MGGQIDGFVHPVLVSKVLDYRHEASDPADHRRCVGGVYVLKFQTSDVAKNEMTEAHGTTFDADYAKASNDYDLLKTLKNEIGSCALSAASSSSLVSTTYNIAEFAVRAARKHYDKAPERLRFVISSSEKQNAYAIWAVQR